MQKNQNRSGYSRPRYFRGPVEVGFELLEHRRVLDAVAISSLQQDSLLDGLAEFSELTSQLRGYAQLAEPMLLLNDTATGVMQTLGGIVPLDDIVENKVVDPLGEYFHTQDPNTIVVGGNSNGPQFVVPEFSESLAGVAYQTIALDTKLLRNSAASASFYGLAEGVDLGNADRSDNAFVFASNIGTDGASLGDDSSALSEVVAHEVGHLLGYQHDVVLQRPIKKLLRKSKKWL